MQDELSALMAERLKLEQQPQVTNQVPPSPGPIAYISQHYHHSAHKAPSAFIGDDLSEAREILAQHRIDADFLLPSQLILFNQADLDQRRRLIELWQIAPLRYGQLLYGQNRNSWPQTSLQQEEQAAQHRYLLMKGDGISAPEAMDSGMDGKIEHGSQEFRANAEPYMISGYTGDGWKDTAVGQSEKTGSWSTSYEYNRASDPVYEERLWGAPGSQPMEHQYGAFQAMSEANRGDEEML